MYCASYIFHALFTYSQRFILLFSHICIKIRSLVIIENNYLAIFLTLLFNVEDNPFALSVSLLIGGHCALRLTEFTPVNTPSKSRVRSRKKPPFETCPRGVVTYARARLRMMGFSAWRAHSPFDKSWVKKIVSKNNTIIS